MRAEREFDTRVRRVLKAQTPAMQQGLRAKIAAMASTVDDHGESAPLPAVAMTSPPPKRAARESRSPARRWTIRIAATLATAAAVMITLRYIAPDAIPMSQPMSAGTTPAKISDEPAVSALMQLVGSVTRKHVTCSSMHDHFYDSSFPRKLADLPPAVADHLGFAPDRIIPDLTSIGLRFDGAGRCNLAGGKTVHVLYQEMNPAAGTDAKHVSVFIQPAREIEGVPLEKPILVAGADETTLMVVWRTSQASYYLVAEDFNSVEDLTTAMSIPMPAHTERRAMSPS